MRIAFFFLAFILSGVQYTLAQEDDPQPKSPVGFFAKSLVIPPSPEAASLGSYGNNKVSLYTGRPQINIPIHDLKGKETNLAISLSYNAGGIKVDELPTWVGLGWSLQAGGVITRSVIGRPDTESNFYNSTAQTDVNTLRNASLFKDQYPIFKKIEQGTLETEPDVYYFNFGSYSGRFYMDHFKRIRPTEHVPLDFSYQGSFVITSEDGTRYEFAEMEKTNILYDGETPSAVQQVEFVSSWFLSRIISPNGLDAIELTYTQLPEPYEPPVRPAAETRTVSIQNGPSTEGGWTPWPECDSKESYGIDQYRITRKYLSEIRLRNKKVIFYTANGAGFSGLRKLESIAIREDDQFVKEFRFSFSFFDGPDPEFDQRLRLDSFQEIGKNGLQKPPYKFRYNETALPAVNSKSIDHWGYYNGAGNSTLIPYPTQHLATLQDVPCLWSSWANREPNEEAMMASTLTHILYPTKGYTRFHYEAHRITPVMNIPYKERIIGGLRVKKIVDYDYTGNITSQRVFDYSAEPITVEGITYNISSGKLQSDAEYVYTGSYEYEKPEAQALGPDSPPLKNDYVKTMFYMVSVPRSQLGSVQGSNVGYSRVTETQIDENQQSNGYKVTTFNNPIATVASYPFSFPPDDFSAGDVLNEVIYNSQNIRVKETNYDYSWSPTVNETRNGGFTPLHVLKAYPMPAQSNRIWLVKLNTGFEDWRTTENKNLSPGIIAGYGGLYPTRYGRISYTISPKWKYLAATNTFEYDGQGNVSFFSHRTTNYDNETHAQPTRIAIEDSKGKSIFTKLKYSKDKSSVNGLSPTASAALDEMTSKHMYSQVIESNSFIEGWNGTYLTAAQRADYQILSSGVFPTEVYMLKEGYNLNEASLTAPGTYEKRAEYSYDASGNLNSYSKTNDTKLALLWSVDGGDVIAEASNTTPDQIAYTSFERGGYEGNWDFSYAEGVSSRTGSRSHNLQGSSITKYGLNSASTYVVSFWAKGGTPIVTGVVQSRDDASPGSDGWRYFEKVVSGVTQVKISSTDAVYLDEVRLRPANVLMKTYVIEPGKGLTAVADENNNLSHFNYDDLGRLEALKDHRNNIQKTFKYNYKSN